MNREHSVTSPYAVGFESQTDATATQPLPVTGTIPEWLSGTMVRTGPSQFEVGNQSYRHWFDGLAMLHGFDIREGGVTYGSRMLESGSFRDATAEGRVVRGEFATDPCRTLFGRIAAIFSRPLTDNCNVNITRIGDQWLAMTETRLPIRFDAESLQVREQNMIDESIPGPVTTAHPQIDADRGVAYNYTVEFGFRTRYRLFSTDLKTGEQQMLAEIPISRPAYMHSFGMTENHLLLTEFPLVVNPLRLKFSNDPFIQNYRWSPERGVRLHMIDKASGRVVRQAVTEPFFAFHHVNAFEEGDDLVIDLITYPDSSIIDQLYLDRLRSNEPVTATGRLMRYRWSADGEISSDAIADANVELPRIDPRRVARSYRHVFGVSVSESGDFLDRIVKIDVEQGASKSWTHRACYPGEPIFVPRPDSYDDGDGVVLSVVLNASTKESFLLVLDAKSMREVARATTPRRITFGFHGHFQS